MNFIQRFVWFRLAPLAILVGLGFLLFSSAGTIQSERFDSINLLVGPGSSFNSGGFDSNLSVQTNASARYVREILDWSQVEQTQGTYNWVTPIPYAAVFSSEKDQGLKVIVVLSGGPTYLNEKSDPTQFLLRWANFVQTAVDQFGEQVDIWEIGSLINSSTGMSAFLTPSTPGNSSIPDPQLYAKMLKVAYKIIKDADPNDEVWMGSLVSAWSGNCAMNPLTFLLEINGAKGWASMDSIEFSPTRGAIAPESAQTSVSSTCASSLPVGNTTLSGEVQAVQDLARQLGGKPVRIEGLGWSGDELNSLSANRGISTDQVLADYLARATVQLAGNNALNSFFWQVDPASQPAAFTALSNLNSILEDAKFESLAQGQSGSVFEYRFTKGSQWIIIAWRTQDGDTPIPVTLSGLKVSSLSAYPVDAAGLSGSAGTELPVDSNGNVTIMLNERPVLFLGKTSDLVSALQQDAADQADLAKYSAKLAAHRGLNQLKAAVIHGFEKLFDSAKEKAIQWGEDKLNSLLN